MDPRVTELHPIMPIANLPSVLAHGILSYERAARLRHASVAMQPVQDRRDQTRVPQGLRLHQYANLYFHARNPMLFKLQEETPSLCVLAVSTEVLKLGGTVITDCNAASDWARVLHPSQWKLVNFDDALAPDWRHPGSPGRYYLRKSRKCAEVLVPHRIPPELLTGAYVINAAARARVAAHAPHLPAIVDPVLFFRSNSW
jgi:ssDNA thymidine ADP-ribosyltransferase, DarT